MSLDDTSLVAATQPAIVVFGIDENQRPHASAFVANEAALAEKAAALMGMRVMPVSSEAELAIAVRVPKGKIFASGRAFTPFCKQALFDEIAAAAPPAPEAAPAEPANKGHPDNSTGSMSPASGSKAATKKAAPLIHAPYPAQPKDWETIEVGATVLATSAPEHITWYECEVAAVDGGKLTLTYLDWPTEPAFVRPVDDVAIMHPGRLVGPVQPERGGR